jgi:hypothetical protein
VIQIREIIVGKYAAGYIHYNKIFQNLVFEVLAAALLNIHTF